MIFVSLKITTTFLNHATLTEGKNETTLTKEYLLLYTFQWRQNKLLIYIV